MITRTIPTEDWCANCRCSETRAVLPLMEIQFNLERVGDDLAFDGLKVDVDPNPKSFVNFDIFLNIVESKNGLTLDCDYNTGLFDEATIGRWLGHYQTILEGMISDVDRPISQMPLLAEGDHRQLAEWNATEAEYPRNTCVHQLFEVPGESDARCNSSSVRKPGVDLMRS